ncbi:VPLPA-CTERM sorting domain-containing protein [Methylocucumis oryzae]|uniref:VPLPA-CTERM sorting domain-containing protein n=1 Tax=Methylocucumis oryzae TaxID=1632867 RepID=UPI0012FEE68C|nr:VPLPA-CTERM sorting domain-containing protein [Methylocucumis oryzae]
MAYLNGVQIGTASGFTSWYSFSATGSLFKAGINTLQFIVTNYKLSGGNPTGIRAEFTSSNVNPVPVPAAIWLFGSSLLALGVLKRRVI